MGSPAPVHSYICGSGNITEGDGKFERVQVPEVCCETVSSWIEYEKAYAKVPSYLIKERKSWLSAGDSGHRGGALFSHEPVFAQIQPCFGSAILIGTKALKMLLLSLPERQIEICLATSSEPPSP